MILCSTNSLPSSVKASVAKPRKQLATSDCDRIPPIKAELLPRKATTIDTTT